LYSLKVEIIPQKNPQLFHSVRNIVKSFLNTVLVSFSGLITFECVDIFAVYKLVCSSQRMWDTLWNNRIL